MSGELSVQVLRMYEAASDAALFLKVRCRAKDAAPRERALFKALSESIERFERRYGDQLTGQTGPEDFGPEAN